MPNAKPVSHMHATTTSAARPTDARAAAVVDALPWQHASVRQPHQRTHAARRKWHKSRGRVSAVDFRFENRCEFSRYGVADIEVAEHDMCGVLVFFQRQ